MFVDSDTLLMIKGIPFMGLIGCFLMKITINRYMHPIYKQLTFVILYTSDIHKIENLCMFHESTGFLYELLLQTKVRLI
uniref:Uncharacterized protein n=1 Tax=Anguilla anguilla TaxID=7936 RepID=A0A0E9X421_ANGAN